jgi:hypothetical protein
VKPGATVQVSGRAGTVIGKVEESRTPSELPALPAPFESFHVAAVREILAECGIGRVLMISYAAGDGRLVFAAFTRDDGVTWFDMQGQALTIEEVSPIP